MKTSSVSYLFSCFKLMRGRKTGSEWLRHGFSLKSRVVSTLQGHVRPAKLTIICSKYQSKLGKRIDYGYNLYHHRRMYSFSCDLVHFMAKWIPN